MTVLEAQIKKEKSQILIEKFSESVKELPQGILHTFLINDTKNPIVWKIITVWKSRNDLEKMRSRGTPAGILIFRSAGAEPHLSVYDIEESSE